MKVKKKRRNEGKKRKEKIFISNSGTNSNKTFESFNCVQLNNSTGV